MISKVTGTPLLIDAKYSWRRANGWLSFLQLVSFASSTMTQSPMVVRAFVSVVDRPR